MGALRFLNKQHYTPGFSDEHLIWLSSKNPGLFRPLLASIWIQGASPDNRALGKKDHLFEQMYIVIIPPVIKA